MADRAASYPMTQFLSNFSSNNYQSGDYFGGHFGPVSDFNQLQTYTLANLSSFLDGYKTAADGYPNVFDIVERISAGYFMNTMDFGKLQESRKLIQRQAELAAAAASTHLFVMAKATAKIHPQHDVPAAEQLAPMLDRIQRIQRDGGAGAQGENVVGARGEVRREQQRRGFRHDRADRGPQ